MGVSASFFVSVVIHRVRLYSEGVKNKQQQPKSRFRPDGRRPRGWRSRLMMQGLI